MKALIVCREKQGYTDNLAPFVREQVEALSKAGISCGYFKVTASGLKGYLQNYSLLKKEIEKFNPDIIHAHYGLCGLLANLQRKVPVVTTYHGSDINSSKTRFLSKLSICLSSWNIFVSQKTLDIAKPKGKFSLIPCGINLEDYPVIGKQEARKIMGLDPDKKYVLFSSSLDNKVKNPELALETMQNIPEVELLELKGYSRKEVATLMNAVDCLLMTSHTEGSPQVIKEAVACGCPIVSVDVGDVKDNIKGIQSCRICNAKANELSNSIKSVISSSRYDGNSIITSLGLDNSHIAKKIIKIYHSIVYKEQQHQ